MDSFHWFMQGEPPKSEVGDHPCWIWAGSRTKAGYGQIRSRGQGTVYAHRLSYEIFHGPIPDGLHILHSCDTPSCVQPAHLRAGTHTENMREAIARNRYPNGRGAKPILTAEQIELILNSPLTTRQLGPQLGISRETVAKVRRGSYSLKRCG